MAAKVRVGDRVTFHYPNFGQLDGYPDYRAHSGQVVTVESNEGKTDEGERGYYVVADDGWRGWAWESELGEASFKPHDPKFCGCEHE